MDSACAVYWVVYAFKPAWPAFYFAWLSSLPAVLAQSDAVLLYSQGGMQHQMCTDQDSCHFSAVWCAWLQGLTNCVQVTWSVICHALCCSLNLDRIGQIHDKIFIFAPSLQVPRPCHPHISPASHASSQASTLVLASTNVKDLKHLHSVETRFTVPMRF